MAPPDLNGDAIGTTIFTRQYADNQLVGLWAPAAASNGNVFVRWEVDGVRQANKEVNIFVSMTANHTARAIYAPLWTLTVQSTNPATGVAITSNRVDWNGASNGTTGFTRQYLNGTSVTLTAPATSPTGKAFVRWTLDSVDQAAGVTTVTVSMAAAHTAVAVYAP